MLQCFFLSLWTGFLASLPKPLGIDNNQDITEDNELCPLYHIKPKKSISLHDQIVASSDVFVYGIQGKSRNVSLWPLHRLLASNANLREVDPNREAETGQYLIPQEGIQCVLCNKIVILHNWNIFAVIIFFFGRGGVRCIDELYNFVYQYFLSDVLILWTDAKLCNIIWKQYLWFLWFYMYLPASPNAFWIWIFWKVLQWINMYEHIQWLLYFSLRVRALYVAHSMTWHRLIKLYNGAHLWLEKYCVVGYFIAGVKCYD